MTYRFLSSLFLVVCLVTGFFAVASGCDTSFEPYAEPDRSFSFFGFFDPGAEESYVRIELLKDGRPLDAPPELDAEVRLENLETNQQIVLENDPILDRFGGVLHNFSTDAVATETRYRLTARRTDNGQSSSAVFETPRDIPVVSLNEEINEVTVEGGTTDKVFFLDVIYLTTVVAIISTPLGPRKTVEKVEFRIPYVSEVSSTDTGHAASLNWRSAIREAYEGPIPATVALEGARARVALTASSTPSYYGDLPYSALFSPGVAPSNVENGYGLVVGVTRDETFVEASEDGFQPLEITTYTESKR